MSEQRAEISQEVRNQTEVAIEQSNEMYWPARFLIEQKGQVPQDRNHIKTYNFSEGDTKLTAWYKAEEDATDKAMKGKKIVYSVLLALGEEIDEGGEILIVPPQADSMLVYPAIAKESYYHPPDRKKPKPEAILREATLEDIQKYLPALNTALKANHHQEVPILSQP